MFSGGLEYRIKILLRMLYRIIISTKKTLNFIDSISNSLMEFRLTKFSNLTNYTILQMYTELNMRQ